MNTQTELESKKVNELHKMVKSEGVPYKVYSKMKKKECITHLLKPETALPGEDPIPNEEETTGQTINISKMTEEFLAKGGTIQKLPPPTDPKSSVPTERTALMVKKKAKTGSGKTIKRKKKITPLETTSPVTGISLKDLLQGCKVKGTIVRKALRSSGIQKPGKQWVWEKGSTDLDIVRNLISGLS